MNSIHFYEDIIDLPHPDPVNHSRMSIQDRAAQFMPFAALTGFSDVISEMARTTQKRITLDEQEKLIINRKLQKISRMVSNHPKVSITWFVPDSMKEGGNYKTVEQFVQTINSYEKTIILKDGSKIRFEDIISIDF